MFFVSKVIFTAFIIAMISTLTKHSDKLGGLIAALPLTTFLVIFWMHYEGQGDVKIANHMRYTLFFVLPTLPMFLIFPVLIERYGFWLATAASVILTALCLYLFNLFSNKIGIRII